MKRIVTFGGGKGQPALLAALKHHPVHISAVVSMMDDGGSSGILRREKGVLPPGDLRRCIAALADDDAAEELQRWEERDEQNHAFGNLAIVQQAEQLGSMQAAADFFMGKYASARFAPAEAADSHQAAATVEVVCVTEEQGALMAEFSDGTTATGEHEVDEWEETGRDPEAHITRLWIEPEVHASQRTLEAIAAADVVVLSMGDLYTSMLPNLVVSGVTAAIAERNIPVIAICNRTTKPGETQHMSTADFARVISQYLAPATLHTLIVDNQSVPVPEGFEATKIENENIDAHLTVVSTNLADPDALSRVSGALAAQTVISLIE